MKRVLTAVVLIPVVLLVVFKAPLWLFALVVAGIIVVALEEYLNIAEAAGIKPFHRLTYAVALLLVYFFWTASVPKPRTLHPYPSLASWWMPFLLFPVIFGIPLVLRKDLKSGLAAVAASGFGTIYIACSLALLISFRADPFQNTLVIFVLFSVWAGDIAAYYVGRSIGRHKLAPVVSPNKSWEGAVASVIASVVVAALVFHFHHQLDSFFLHQWTFYTSLVPIKVSLSHVLVLGVLTNVAAQFGDLFESALKRGAGVKDSGTLLPGHGGMLDRIDALLFAIPTVWYYANLTGLLQAKFF
jgi:phosphatidate cytidylyltransferase